MVELFEDYILHDASDKVYENAEAGIEGLPVREEVFRFELANVFKYEKRSGFEGKKLDTKFTAQGEYSQNGKEVILTWPDVVQNFTPELVKKYPSLIFEFCTLRSSTDKNLIFC